MSGRRFRYDNDTLCREVFNWSLNPEYGLGKHPDYVTSVKAARRINPMKDTVISEMLYDMFCLIHSFDWAESGDTDALVAPPAGYIGNCNSQDRNI